MASTSRGDAILIHGGYQLETGCNLDDLWWLHARDGVWHSANPKGTRPAPRAGHTLTALSRQDDVPGTQRRRPATGQQQIVLYGGYGEAAMSDVHVLLLADDGEPSEWVQPHVLGAPPPPRCAHSAVPTPCGGAVVVFGGFTGSGEEGGADGSVWVLEVDTEGTRWASERTGTLTVAWSQLHPETPDAVKLPRSGHEPTSNLAALALTSILCRRHSSRLTASRRIV